MPPSMTDLFAASSWNILCQSQLYGDDWVCWVQMIQKDWAYVVLGCASYVIYIYIYIHS